MKWYGRCLSLLSVLAYRSGSNTNASGLHVVEIVVTAYWLSLHCSLRLTCLIIIHAPFDCTTTALRLCFPPLPLASLSELALTPACPPIKAVRSR